MLRLVTLTLLALLGLGGCTALSPLSNLTKVELTLEGSSRLNPDLHDRPSPIVVRLIGLKHPVAFENGEFFALYEHPKETLALDFVIQEELELRPGEQRSLRLHTSDDTRFIGVIAAYRDLPEAVWRLTVPLSPKARNRTHVYLGERGLSLPQHADSGATQR